MKKFLSVIAVAAIFSACDRNDSNNENDAAARDAYQTLNGKMMAQHALMIEREDKLLEAENKAALAKTQAASTRSTRSTRTSRSNSQPTSYSNSSERSDAGLIQQPAQKKGWSKAAKGAVIGGVTGAVAGAVISKDKSKGAIIGGVVGAGGGYILGRSKDKKDGRY